MIRQNRCKIFTLMISMLLVCVLGFAAGAEEAGIKIDEQNFPDAAFRNALLKFDTNNDRELSKSEIYGITELSLMSRNIESLQGIEYLTELKELSCGSNKLKTLDVSKNTKLTNLYCGENKLTELDVSNNPELVELNFVWNDVRTIDTSNNSKLKELAVSGNPVGKLDLSNMPDLEELFCPWSGITELDVSYNPKLYYISAIGNRLTELDLSNNPMVRVLMVDDNPLKTLDISKCPELVKLVDEKEAHNDQHGDGVEWTIGDELWGSGTLIIDNNDKLYSGSGEYAEAKMPEIKTAAAVGTEKDTAVEYTDAYPEIMNDVEKEVLYDFFCKWSQGDVNELPTSFVPAQRTSNEAVKAIVDDLLELGTPVSFQINDVHAGSGSSFRAYQCTLEMAHEDGQPARFVQIDINVDTGATRGVDAAGMKTMEPAEYDPAGRVYSLAAEAVVQAKLASTLRDESAEGDLLPIGKSVEQDGLRVELISGLVRGTDSWIYYTVEDLEGRYDNCSLDAFIEDNICEEDWYAPRTLLHDIKAHKFYNLVHIHYKDMIDANERGITLSLNSAYFIRNGWADLSELAVERQEEAADVTTVPSSVWHSDYEHEDRDLTEDEKKILDCSEPMKLQVAPDITVNGIGWIDGKLHVQIRTESNDYQYDYLLIDGQEYYFADRNLPYSPLRWYTGSTSYEEYVLNYKPEEAEQLKLSVQATYTKEGKYGFWDIKFPLSTICPDVKVKTEEKTEEKTEAPETAAENTISAGAEEIQYISSYPETRHDYKKYTIWEFFCRWAQGDTDEMPYSFIHDQRVGGEETQRKIDELLKWKPLSYRIDDVKVANEEETYYCTVEMEPDASKDSRYERVVINLVKDTEWYYGIDLDGIQFLGVPESLPTDNVISLSGEAIIRDQLDYFYQGVREKLQPIGETHDCKGIRMEVISGYAEGKDTWYLYSLQDLDGKMEGFSPDTWDLEDDIGAMESYQHSKLYCDEAEHKCYYLLHLTHESEIASDEKTVKLTMRSIHFDSNGWADLIPLLKEHMEPVEGVHPTKQLWDRDWENPDKVLNPEDYKVLDYTKPLDIEMIPGVYVTGIGWIDNQLHIQIRMADGLDGYSEWIDSILYGRSGYDRQIPYTPLSWSVGNLYYEEYMYSYTPEDIDGLSLILSVNISRDRIDGPWVVRFPLSTIFPEVKEKTEESGTTWQDFGEVKEPEATEQVTDEVVELENSPYYVPFDETAPAEEKQTFKLELKDGAFVLTQGEISYRLNDDGTATITKIGKEFGEPIEIPETVTVTFDVNGVDYEAFLEYVNKK